MKYFLFTRSVQRAVKAKKAGIDYIIVDMESRGKKERQDNYDLEQNEADLADIRELSEADTPVIGVRINSMEDSTEEEIERSLECGAELIMLPMAKAIHEVERFLAIVDGRCETLVQVETPEMVGKVDTLRNLDWDYVHIGLNDLMIGRGYLSIWESVLDGTVEKVCSALAGRSYGFGGITVIGGGNPIPFILLLQETVRLGCSMGILRRSFKAEMIDRDMASEIRLISSTIETLQRRGETAIEHDHTALMEVLHTLMEGKR